MAEVRSAIRFITTHAKAIWGDFNVALTQSLEGASTPTQRPSPAELTEEERGCLDRLLDFNTQPQRLSETNRLLLAARRCCARSPRSRTRPAPPRSPT